MFTRIKSDAELTAMRASGRILADILQQISYDATEGMTGKDVSQFVASELKAQGAKASFLGYLGFPDVICISLNDGIVHGIPNTAPFRKGDIVGFDFGVTYQGMITDSAFTMVIGKSESTDVKRLLETTEQSLYAGIDRVRDGVRVGDIGAAIQKVLQREKLGIVRDMVGHGVGHAVHEDPNIPNYGVSGTGPVLKAGMTVAIEPMATLGSGRIKVAADGWGIHTADGSLSAQFEHTVLVTPKGSEILTAWC